MKGDKDKSLDNCEIADNLIKSESSDNRSHEKEREIKIIDHGSEINEEKSCLECPLSENSDTILDNDKNQPPKSDIESKQINEPSKSEVTACQSINENSNRLQDNEALCQNKIVLRQRKTEVVLNRDDELMICKSKNECRKTEKKCAIKNDEDDSSNNESSTLCCSSTSQMKLIESLSEEAQSEVKEINWVKSEYLEIKLEAPEITLISENTLNETEQDSTVTLPYLKLADEDSLKSKDNSESDTKISSSASENSIVKATRKRRRRREVWWTKKRKRSEGSQQKNNSIITTSVTNSCVQLAEVVNGGLLVDESTLTRKSKTRDFEDHEVTAKKSKEFAIPSPSLADINLKAAAPESTATFANKVSRAYLCLCRKKPNVFISGNNNAGDLYCQALDCINNRIVGCCNAIPSQDVGLYRASEKAAYQMMCTVHQERLVRHNCCPGCGLFCTQGKYMMCKLWHHFHKTCFNFDNKNSSLSCPHCGENQLKSVVVSIHAPKDPVFLPVQKPVRNMRPAKMTIVRGNVQMVEEDDVPAFNIPTSLFNFDGEDGSPQNGVSQIFQKDKLAHLLNIACKSFSKMCYNNRYSYKSLYSAAQNGEVEKLLKGIASGLNPNHVFEENNRQTALHVAATNGHLPAVHILLQARAEINVFDGEQNTPLTAAISSKHNDVVKYLVKCGANLILKGEDGMTPLHIAAKIGNVGACFHLLNGTHLPNRYIDSLDDGGWTPMVWASEFNHLEVVRFLISKGADSLIKDAEQNIALHWAAFGGSIDIVEMFLNDGSDINAVNVHGDTPLHIAARQHKYSCVLLLLARGARSDLKNKNGELPRDCADSPTSDIYKGITLNMEISALLTRFQDRSPKIISNDISRGKERNQIQCVNSVDDEGEPEDFIYVTESCFTSKIAVDRTITSLQSCNCRDICASDNCSCGGISIKCWYDADGRLKPDFNYVDPPPIFECNQVCLCNRITCRNRVVQNGVTCRFQLFRTEGRGWGIRTLNLISKGTFVCEYVGEIISDWEADHREDDSYLFDLENRDGETYCIDARRYGNIARFINHMCVPNVIPVHIFVEHQDLRFPRIAFFANRDILPNEELGYNYGDKFWVIKWKTFTCVCGSEKCLYSENTIKTTLDNYQKKLSEENP